MPVLVDIAKRLHHMIYKDASVRSQSTNNEQLNHLLYSHFLNIEDAYSFFHFLVIAIVDGLNGRFALITDKVQDTEPFVYLIDVSQRSCKHCDEFKN